jgi:hypothetical protein
VRRAVLLLLLTAAALVSPGGVRPAGAAPLPGLVVDQITPEVPRDLRAPITITGTVTGTPGSRVRVRLRWSHPVKSREELATYAAGQGYSPLFETKVQTTPLDDTGKLPFQITTTPQSLRMSQAGVYPFAVEVLDAATDQQLAIDHTFLTYIPQDATLKRTRIAVALPVR